MTGKAAPASAKIIVTPKGEDYEGMRDALAHAQAIADVEAGRDEPITLDEMQALLDAPSPLTFWREKRGLTRAALAEAAHLRESDIEDLESGKASTKKVMTRIATVLKVAVEELL
jgi:ribosome-binding protein aMBF1 (putative translation factor)